MTTDVCGDTARARASITWSSEQFNSPVIMMILACIIWECAGDSTSGMVFRRQGSATPF